MDPILAPGTALRHAPPEEEDDANTVSALEAATGDHGAFYVRAIRDNSSENPEVVGLEVQFVGSLAESVTGALSCDGAGLVPAGTNCAANVVRTGSKPVEEVIEKFSPEGKLEEGWGVKGRLDVGAAEDGYLDGIAVDPSGKLWVKDGEYVYRFKQAGEQMGTPTRSMSIRCVWRRKRRRRAKWGRRA